MITFSTEFPLAKKNTATDVLRLACEWLAGSPHTALSDLDTEALPQQDSKEVRRGGEVVILAAAKGSDYAIEGLQYRRTEETLEWVTSIVARQDSYETLFSLQVSCEALGTAVRLPAPRKPYFIKQALTSLGGGEDGEIPVQDKPYRLSPNEANIAAALIGGVAKNRLPIVYLSVGFDDQASVNPDDLAKLLSGLAHVIVEPSRSFSAELRGRADGRNVYGGSLGVYWPESSARKTYFPSRFDNDAKLLQRAIADDIRIALANRRLRTGCTWTHLQEQLSRTRIDRLREIGSESVEDYAREFDAELQAKEKRLAEAEAEISNLNLEIRRLSANSASAVSSVLAFGKEHNLYPLEVHDLVLSTLSDSIRNLKDGSRRQHVIKDIVAANTASGAGQEIEAQVKGLLKTYQSMDAKLRKALTDLGFTITEDGKHFKLIFRGDDRYMFTLSKTSSDHRAGKNIAGEIGSTLF